MEARMVRRLHKKPWTVLVYMVSDAPEVRGTQNLDGAAQGDLDKIFEAIDPVRTHLAIQTDFSHGTGVLRKIAGNAPELLPETNASDPEVLKTFLKDALPDCPADRYALLFWGHSKGTAGLFTDAVPGGISKTLTLPKLAGALRSAFSRPIDIVLFKNCCLSALETAYELQDVAHFIISSQTRVRAEDWPYPQMFGSLPPRPRTTQSIATAMVDALGDFYLKKENRPGKSEIPFTLLNLGAVPSLTAPIKGLVGALRKARYDAAVGNEVRDVFMKRDRSRKGKDPGDPALPDVVTLCKRLRALRVGDLTRAADALERRVRTRLVVHHRPKKSRFHGVGINYPPAVETGPSIFPRFPDGYRDLRLCKATGWQEIALDPVFAARTDAFDNIVPVTRDLAYAILSQRFGLTLTPTVRTYEN
jgi:hypothetical protein